MDLYDGLVRETVDSPKAFSAGRRYALRLFAALKNMKPTVDGESGIGYHGVKIGKNLVDIVVCDMASMGMPRVRGFYLEKPDKTFGPVWFASKDAA